jgi:adenine-specific DNA glycosylase
VAVAEILLQKTRGEAVVEVRMALIRDFASAEALATASSVRVYEIVAPLGLCGHRTRAFRRWRRTGQQWAIGGGGSDRMEPE